MMSLLCIITVLVINTEKRNLHSVSVCVYTHVLVGLCVFRIKFHMSSNCGSVFRTSYLIFLYKKLTKHACIKSYKILSEYEKSVLLQLPSLKLGLHQGNSMLHIVS
jgi:hypothetical protein